MTGAQLIRLANTRSRAETEFREVEILIGGGAKSRVLMVRTLRQIDGDRCRTLFCVTKPFQFRNVNYVADERRSSLAMKVHLYLPYVFGTLKEISPERHGETFLGSDFSYDDLREWLPDAGFVFEEPIASDTRLRIRGRCVDPNASWRQGRNPFDVIISSEDGFVWGIDYLDGKERPVRAFSIKGRTVVEGITLPSQMLMSDFVLQHQTSIRLCRARYDLQCVPGIFEPEFRKHTREYLESL